MDEQRDENPYHIDPRWSAAPVFAIGLAVVFLSGMCADSLYERLKFILFFGAIPIGVGIYLLLRRW